MKAGLKKKSKVEKTVFSPYSTSFLQNVIFINKVIKKIMSLLSDVKRKIARNFKEADKIREKIPTY
jgi:hypothetical protein